MCNKCEEIEVKIAEYATACGAKLEFSGYQAGWSGF
jgi:hypothetical protein